MTTRTRRWCAGVAAVGMIATACTGDDDPGEPGPESTPTITDVGSASAGSTVGESSAAPPLEHARSVAPGLVLSEGTASPDDIEPNTVLLGDTLTDDEVAAVLGRLPEWDVPTDDQQDTALPAESLSPPVVGDTLDAPFPAPDGDDVPAPATLDGTLDVLRFQPEGDVDIAPFIAVTFDEPMIEVATLDQLDAADVPVVLEPAIEGRWRWIGTRTLRFEAVPDPDTGDLDRLPAATDYTVTVPAGTRSATGAVLDDEFSFSFETPAATVISLNGLSDSTPLDPVFVATFDQRVDPEAVLETVSFEAGDVGAVRLATDDEIAASTEASVEVDNELDGRTVAFVPDAPLTPDTNISIAIGPDVPSLEGPKSGADVFTETGQTFPPLELTDAECFDPCRPFSSFELNFSNPLDDEAFDPSWFSVEPAVGGLDVAAFDNVVFVNAATSGNTTYTVTVSPDVVDAFGQTLGEAATAEFEVGDPRPFLEGPGRDFVVTDPFAPSPSISYTTVGHERLAVTAWQVTAGQYDEFIRLQEAAFADVAPPDPDWPVLLETTIDIDADQESVAETVVDLSGAFADWDESIVVRASVEPEVDPKSDDFFSSMPALSWVQQTDLAADVFVSADELLVWVTDLRTGEPVGDSTIELIGASETVTTDGDGVVRIPLTERVDGVTATSGDRSVTVPARRFDGWNPEPRMPNDLWYVVGDRGVYRPGEIVRIAGLIRTLTADEAQLALIDDATTVEYTVFDPQGVEIEAATTELNALGGFNFSVDLPEGVNSGSAFVEMRLGESSGFHEFQIQEFRTPEFEVSTRAESPDPLYAIDPATVAVAAQFFAGGPLSGSDVEWSVSASTTAFSPPGWDDFSFGEWIPWWFFDIVEPELDESAFAQYRGRTDGSGAHLLQIDFDDLGNAPTDQPTMVNASAAVFDVNRQAIASSTDLIVHPAQYYVGLRSDTTFVTPDEPIVIDAIVVDVDGEPIEGRDVSVTAELVGSTSLEPQTCEILSGTEAVSCEFVAESGGQYEITAVVTDDDGRANRSVFTQWVSGAPVRDDRSLDRGDVMIVPDSEFHAPGDTAELLVQAPFAPASGLLTVTRAGIESVETFAAPDGSAVLSLPIADDDIPSLDVRVDMVGAEEGDGREQPAFASGQVQLNIPPVTRELGVVAAPASAELAPGATTSVTVTVADPDGEPLSGAGAAVIVVDEAVLSVTGYELPDPLDVFYPPMYSGLDVNLLRDAIVLADPERVGGGRDGAETTEAMDVESNADFAEESAPAATEEVADESGGEAADGSDVTTIDVREDFSALAVFAPDETTGADGTVEVEVELPDNLTRYRVMAVAVDGADRFGSAESTITARLPISVRPSAPRFLNFGDAFELPIVVQNQTDAAAVVDVAIQTANLDLADGAGRRIEVPANDRVEVRFPATAADAGTARFRVASTTTEFADAAEVSLPVYTPATAEAFATYGVVDTNEPVAQPVLAPDNVITDFGGLEISTSSTALQALTDAVLYLEEYRYGSADGLASRIMAVAALRDVLDAFDAAGLPAPGELDAQLAGDIEELQRLQNDDGGFPWWQRGRPSEPWVSVQSTHALVLADQADYDIERNTLDLALAHLARIDDFIDSDDSDQTRDAISAYALFVRDLAGDSDPDAARAVYEGGVDETLQIDSIAQLWPVIEDEATRQEIALTIANAAVETAGAATFATDYGEDAYLIAHSDRRTDGIVLQSLVSEDPDSDLIPKVVTGLIGNQVDGRWNNAQENSFILLALKSYFDTFEAADPDFAARVWLGDTYAVDAEFRERSTDTSLTTVPMSSVIAEGDTDLVVQRDGDGRLYYRLGLRYAPSDLQLDARDEGFVVDRTYEAIDDPGDVVRNEDGTWDIAAGASVRVRLSMVADARRTNVALIDPLPAGFEAVNPALATAIVVPPDEADVAAGGFDDGAWAWRWFDHQNVRDDRVEAFSAFLSGGTYEYSYVARATTPGEFVVPPARAEEIFSPEVFGRTASTTVTVSER